MQIRIPFVRSLLPSLAAFLLFASAALADPADFVGHWQGEIEVPGSALGFDVDLSVGADGALAGDLSIPVQNLHDFALAELRVDGDSIHFELAGIPGSPTFDGTRTGDTVAGSFVQGGANLTFEMKRASAEDAADRLADFGALVDKALADLDVPGAAIAVVYGGEVVLAEGYGLRDVPNGLPMTGDSLFAIGSTTKAMTATLLGMQADEGQLDFDAPVVDYLPEFRLSDADLTRRVTVRDVLTHRTGLPRHDLAWYGREDAAREELLAAMAHFEFSAGLREKWQYNNFMFMAAGYLAGRIDGSDWETVLRRRLLEPLGMARTNVHVAESQQDADHALPHQENDDHEIEVIPFRPVEAMGPAGAVNSSVREMAQWLLLNLNGGKVKSGDGSHGDVQLIQSGTLADIQSGHMAIGSPSTRADVSAGVYGLGWVVDSYRGHRRLHHGGGIDGFNTQVTLLPDDGLGVVAFTNRNSGLSTALVQTAADRMLELEPVDWLAEQVAARAQGQEAEKQMAETKESIRVAGTSPSHQLADYAGVYEHPGYGRLTFTVADAGSNGLQLDFHGIAAALEHWHYDTWSGADVDGDEVLENMKFLFRTDYDGLVAAVEAPLEPMASPIVFERRPDPKLGDPAYLAQLAGAYTGLSGARFTVQLQGDQLTLHVPGQPIYDLEPTLSGRFQLAQVSIVSVEFLFGDDGAVTGLRIHQPGGGVTAERAD